MKRLLVVCALVVALCMSGMLALAAQGVAAASMSIVLTDDAGAPIANCHSQGYA